MVPTFELDIDSDETFLAWLFDTFAGENLQFDERYVPGEVVATVKDQNEGRWARDMNFHKLEDGRIGWYDPDDLNLQLSEGPLEVEKLLKELEEHEVRQGEEDEDMDAEDAVDDAEDGWEGGEVKMNFPS